MQRTNSALLLVLFMVGFASLPSAVAAQGVTITQAHAPAAPNWTVWEYYEIYATGTQSGGYTMTLTYGYFDGITGNIIAQHNSQPGFNWTDSDLGASSYPDETDPNDYYVHVETRNMFGIVVGSTAHFVTLTNP